VIGWEGRRTESGRGGRTRWHGAALGGTGLHLVARGRGRWHGAAVGGTRGKKQKAALSVAAARRHLSQRERGERREGSADLPPSS